MDAPDEEALLEPATPTLGGRAARWLSWILGAAAVAAVVVVALRFSEGRQFLRIAERAEPWWLAIAFALQAATYLGEAQVWRMVGRAARFALPLGAAYRLSLAKLFVDQALPSGGLSGTIVVARALRQRGMPMPVVMAGIVADIAAYYATYVVCLALALLISLVHHRVTPLVALVAVGFGLVAAGVTVTVLTLSGRRESGLVRALARLRPLRWALGALAQADRGLARSPGLLARAAGCELAIFVLDAGTMWVLVEALGTHAPLVGVFASFMIASLFRTVGILPGGLGTFEATSVLTLSMIGVDVAVALSATLLFRGLSFWLPMAPGLWASRRLVRPPGSPAMPPGIRAAWARPAAELLAELGAGPTGLSAEEAASRLRIHGANVLRERKPSSRLRVLGDQLRSPLLLLLVFAAGASLFAHQHTDAAIVLVIVVATVGIGYRREHTAQTAVDALQARVATRATVLRDDRPTEVAVADVVPGDVALLSAGSLVPADAVVLEAKDCHVSEAVLTGESFPVEKSPGPLPADAPLARRTDCVFMGTNVRSGTARCLVVATGQGTQFAAIAHRLALRRPPTEFDRGIRRFGTMLTVAMLVIVLLVFVAHVLGGRPAIETLLFSIALAVGLSPELLPAILSVNLSRGAATMAREGVLVRHLPAIENLGSMDVLCTDKTGTLTAGVIDLEGAYAPDGTPSLAVRELGALNAALETGIPSPLDEAIVRAASPDVSHLVKRAEIPFDFTRKRVSVVVERPEGIRLLTKGAFDHVLEACATLPGGARLDDEARAELGRRRDDWSRRGIRVLAVAFRDVPDQADYGRDDEVELTFAGILTFVDQPKEGVSEALAALAQLGVAVKVITGDGELVTRWVAERVGLGTNRVLTGADLDELGDEALWREAERTDLFVEVDPNQKERIIGALEKMGHVVGFLGDGVNDAPAMHAADTSLSVDQAVDVARDAADFVLLEKHLDVIRRGIEEGRRTFANTTKYVLTTTSANLGNMLSMACASLFLPFLPLLAGQILLNNFLSDIPAIGIADDSVDPELVDRPRRWDIRFIGRFMVEFGLLSSLFDFLTFTVLLGAFHAAPELFRTGWFVESLLTELVIALVVRTRRPFFRSRPGSLLLWSTVALVALAFATPYLPRVEVLGFVHAPPPLLAALAGITVLYVGATELTKRWFYRHAA